MNNPFDEINERLRRIENLLSAKQSVNDAPVYLKVDKAAAFLSTTPNAIRVMVTKEQIPFIKKLGKLYFLQSELIQWLESGRPEVEKIEDVLIQNNMKKQHFVGTPVLPPEL